MAEVAPKMNAARKLRRVADPLGHLLTETFHFLGLFAIGAATVWAAGVAFFGMFQRGHASIEDLLLLFIYLEIGSMVGIYFKTNHMPVRFLVYVGITALTRHLIGYIQHETVPDISVIYLPVGILVLSISVFVIRYTSFNYPSRPGTEHETNTD
jgi:phosphate starvation-inducible membrane PsiE